MSSAQMLTRHEAAVLIEAVLPQAPRALARLQQGGTILDVGCGAGDALTYYARRFPRARIVGLEIDGPSVELARRSVAEAGAADRVEVRLGDASEIEEWNVYDLVTLPIAPDEEGGPAECRGVLERVWRALQPGGSVVLAGVSYPDDLAHCRASPVSRLRAGIQAHEAMVGFETMTPGQLGALLSEIGFTHVRVVEQPLPMRYALLAERGQHRQISG